MGIDGVGNSPPKVSTSQAQTVDAPKPSAPKPPPPAPSAPKPPPTEAFADPKKKPMSITGKYQPPPADQMPPPREDLQHLVASQRSMANAGVTTAAPVSGPGPSTEEIKANQKKLMEATEKDDDVAIRNLINGDPDFLKGIPAGDKGRAMEVLRSGHTSKADKEAMAHIVASCESKGELRDVVSAAAGNKGKKPEDGKGPHVYPPPTQADMHKYDKELGAYHPDGCYIADLLNPANKTLPDKTDADPNGINARYHLDIKDAPVANPNASVSLAPGDEAARRKFLDKMTQTDPGDPKANPVIPPRTAAHHEFGCGPAVVVASCMQQKEPAKALSKLCDYNLGKEGNLKNEEDRAKLADLKKKIDGGGPISREEVDLLQRTTYDTMQQAKGATGGDVNSKSIGMKALQKVMTESGVGYSGGVPALIDMDNARDARGQKNTDHFVLVKPGLSGQIYDPWPREGGRQIVSERGPNGIRDEGAYQSYRSAIEETAFPID